MASNLSLPMFLISSILSTLQIRLQGQQKDDKSNAIGNVDTLTNSRSAQAKQQILLQRAMEGNLDEIKGLLSTDVSNKSIEKNETLKIINAVDKEGNSAVHGAVFGGHVDVVRYLVDLGADIASANNMGCTPFWLACGYNHLSVLKILMENDECMKNCLSLGNNTGDTPLIAAASRNHVDICRILLSQDEGCGMLRIRNKNGDSVLSVICANGYDGEILDLITSHEIKQAINGTIGNRIVNMTNVKGLTPLLIGCERNYVDVVKKLLQQSAGVDLSQQIDEAGNTVLAVASFCGCIEMATFLLSSECTMFEVEELINITNNAGATPLWLSARTGNAKMAKILLDSGADVGIVDLKEKLTAKGAAEKYKKTKVVKLMEDNGL
eukprot:CAMPEP_0194405442 /NCGR_PEP_ID=MMETSP0176-20130528/3819_1 /TAXON_ID=216777 /ORGANISM="Proboscia alata, Strain PI-D3" /LENGTH=380 /DNA_ID=CAMNT_0039204237 /DNA_START=8 /DNA_END=1150 /DNA_ORIENTATION=+